tara:strand:- start:1709 stop:1948 length:240 start_codon:yes stop_codon:yes gene_type:complete
VGKIAKVFKKVIPKKKKPAPVVAKAPVDPGKSASDLAAAGRIKSSADRVNSNRKAATLGTTDDAVISRPGARSATLLGQ